MRGRTWPSASAGSGSTVRSDAPRSAPAVVSRAPRASRTSGRVHPRRRSPAPRVGERFVIPGLADTLARIAAEGPGRAVPRAAGRGDRRRVVALRGRPRRAPLGMGRAPPLRLPRRRGVRAPAQRAGRRRARRAGAVRRPPAGAALADRGDEARPRRRSRPRRRRAVAGRVARPGPPARAPRARPRRPCPRPGAVGPASGRHDVPLRGRRRRDGDLADPERLRDVRVGGRPARDGRRPPESGGRLRRGRRAPQPARAGQEAVPHDHPRDASRRQARCSGRSA